MYIISQRWSSKISNLNSGKFLVLTAFQKKDHPFFGKNTLTFSHNIAYMVKFLVFYYNYDWELIEIIQSSALENPKDNIMYIEIMMAHK